MGCPSCGNANPDGKKFCGDCGAPLPMRCTGCGAENPPGKKFCGDCGAALMIGASTARAEAVLPASPTPSAQRRQLTVMFCDLVGSTALASKLDPEDLREVIGAYHQCVDDTVRRFGGFVAKYMGDGVLVYFGYPQAHEDDAERAVRSGLVLIEGMKQLDADERLRVRIGVATGLVIVGDLIGAGAAQEQAVVGETPNLAARLQTVAEPDSVVIAASTRRLIGGLFEYDDLGAVDAKGFAEPVRAWRVRSESAIDSRYEALRSGETALVGRDEETELLRRRWRRATSGDGEVVLLSGEPGIGKSRLTAALLEEISGEPHTRLLYFCSPRHTDSALHPIIRQLERTVGFARDEDPSTRLAKLDALLSRVTTSLEDARLIADLLSLPDGRFPRLDLTPQQRKQRTLEALLRQLEYLARLQPVLLIFEDVHWIDPTSLELMDRTVERIRGWPVLLLMTFRPEFRPLWTGQAHVMTVALSGLDPRDGAAIVERIAGNRALPTEIVNEIVERTDGVPLFVEELTKAVLEGRRWQCWRRGRVCSRVGVGGSGHTARFAHGAPGSSWPGRQRGRANRCGDWTGVLVRAAVRRCAVVGDEAASCSGTACRGGPRVLSGTAASGHLSVQARAGAGRRLWDVAACAEAGVTRAHRDSSRGSLSRNGGPAAGTPGASLRSGGVERKSDRLLGARGTAVTSALRHD